MEIEKLKIEELPYYEENNPFFGEFQGDDKTARYAVEWRANEIKKTITRAFLLKKEKYPI